MFVSASSDVENSAVHSIIMNNCMWAGYSFKAALAIAYSETITGRDFHFTGQEACEWMNTHAYKWVEAEQDWMRLPVEHTLTFFGTDLEKIKPVANIQMGELVTVCFLNPDFGMWKVPIYSVYKSHYNERWFIRTSQFVEGMLVAKLTVFPNEQVFNDRTGGLDTFQEFPSYWAC